MWAQLDTALILYNQDEYYYLNIYILFILQALDQLGHHTDIWNKEVKDTWQTFFRVITRIMKKGYDRQHPGAAIIFVGKGGTSARPIVPKPLVVEQKNRNWPSPGPLFSATDHKSEGLGDVTLN